MRTDISRDIYAHLWVTDESRRLWQELADKVYAHDDISSSLRNRFYLEHLTKFVAANGTAAFINIAAGFSNYPYLLPTGCFCAEADFAHVVDYKMQRTSQWQKDGALPQRFIESLGVDLDSGSDRDRLARTLLGWCQDRLSFVMMEGLTYYLPAPVLQHLLQIIGKGQSAGSQLAFEYWTPDAEDYPVFCRLKQYLSQGFAVKRQAYELLDLSFVRSIPGYELQESSDIAAQELLYSNTRVLQERNNRLPIHFAVLNKM